MATSDSAVRPAAPPSALDRRAFLGSALAAGAALAGVPGAAPAAPLGAPLGAPSGAPLGAPTGRPFGAPSGAPPFRLRYAPHFGQFRAHAGDDLVAQLEFGRAEGFTAWEDNEMRGRPVADQERVARAMGRLGMQMGVIVGHTLDWREPTLLAADPAARDQFRDRFLAEVRASADVARRVNGRWMVVVPGVAARRVEPEYQMVQVVETLRRAAALLEPTGVGMLLEPLNTRRDHPGQLLHRVPQLQLVVRAVNSPALRILYDCYHVQVEDGNLIPAMDAVWPDVAYVQVADTPGRLEPGTGEVNYANVFRHLRAKGYAGLVGIEHGASRPGREGERALIDAYRAVDPAGD